ncbi:hypothetical protein LT493_21700 [Streptomyces tricolor]|nr:hypothetical protein [Streptomyces tricolor]
MIPRVRRIKARPPLDPRRPDGPLTDRLEGPRAGARRGGGREALSGAAGPRGHGPRGARRPAAPERRPVTRGAVPGRPVGRGGPSARHAGASSRTGG